MPALHTKTDARDTCINHFSNISSPNTLRRSLLLSPTAVMVYRRWRQALRYCHFFSSSIQLLEAERNLHAMVISGPLPASCKHVIKLLLLKCLTSPKGYVWTLFSPRTIDVTLTIDVVFSLQFIWMLRLSSLTAWVFCCLNCIFL